MTIIRSLSNCNEYSITDASAHGLVINKLLDDGTFEVVLDYGTLVANTTTVHTFAEDGVYQLEFTIGGVVTNSNVVVNCSIRNCLLAFIMNQACATTAKPSDDQLYYYNALMTTHYAFQAMINTDYIDNWSYSTLEPHQLNDMLGINKLLAKMTEYCNALNLNSADTAAQNCNC